MVTAWLLIQVSETILPLFGFEESTVRLVVVVLAIGFLPALIFAWAFEITPEGLQREEDVDRSSSVAPQTGKKLDRLIMVVLALGLGYFAIDKFVLDPSRDAAREAEVAQQARSEALVGSYGDKSIAVLPFVNMSSDPEQEYFSDGISEELLNLLAQVHELRVTSRSSSFSFKGQSLGVMEIAKRLNVAHVLEGSVRKSGNRVRITAQLIDARTDTHLWSQTWDRELTDVFAIQDEISAQVVQQLKITLLGGAPRSRPTDPVAYNLFLQGRYFLDQFSAENLEKAGELYQRVLEIDPDYPPGLKGLAEVRANQAAWGLIPFDEGLDTARSLVYRAAELDPFYADAWSGIGSLHQYFTGDLKAAAENFSKAVSLGPNQATIIGDAGVFALYLGRVDQGVELMHRQVQLDPVSPTAHSQLARALLMQGRLDEAIKEYHMVLDLNPGRTAAWYWLGMAYLLNSDFDQALESVQREENEPMRLTGLTMVHHSLGNAGLSDTALLELEEKFREEFKYTAAYAHAWRGEADAAFEWLLLAEEADDVMTGLTITPFFDSIRSDPRWPEMLDRLGYSKAQLDTISFEINLP